MKEKHLHWETTAIFLPRDNFPVLAGIPGRVKQKNFLEPFSCSWEISIGNVCDDVCVCECMLNLHTFLSISKC